MIATFKHMLKTPYPSPDISGDNISGGRENTTGGKKAAEMPSKSIGKKSMGEENPGMNKKETHIPIEANIKKIFLFPSLSDKAPVKGVNKIAAIMNKLARKKAMLSGMFFSSMKKVPAHVKYDMAAML